MPSFDIVSEIEMQEIDNAVNQTNKEIGTRFDFRGGKSELELDKNNNKIKIVADDELKLRSIHQILENRLARREIDCRILKYSDPLPSSHQILRQEVELKNGLTKEESKKITQFIKNLKLKVQAQIQDDRVRVTGKKIDELQTVISEMKASDLNLPLQYINMRS